MSQMLNFIYDIPTKVFFWKGEIAHLAEQIKCFGDKVLLTYGSWSIKKIWLYDQVIEIFKKENIHYRELADIQPNPDITSFREWIAICKQQWIQCILAVGGGSIIDASKAIALGYFYPGDPRDIFSKETNIDQALPIGTILTLAATGSEMNRGMVISNRELLEKRNHKNIVLCPKFSILDPSYTYSVPPKQTVAGIVDIMSHIFEQYFSPTPATEAQDSMAEWLLQTCIYYGHQVIADPENYDARANLMWTWSLALNGLLGLGKTQDRATHQIEHALSAVYDITHGDGLAIVFPHRMDYVLGEGKDPKILEKFVDFALHVRNIPGIGEPLAIAKAGIHALKNFRSQIGAPMKLSDVDIIAPDCDLLADKAVAYWPIGWLKSLGKEEVIEILQHCE